MSLSLTKRSSAKPLLLDDRVERATARLVDTCAAPTGGRRFIALALAMSIGVLTTSKAPGAEIDPGSENRTRVAPEGKGLSFEVTGSASVPIKAVAARVYVMLAPDRSSADPRLGPNWFRPEPFFAMDVEGWKPGEPVRIDARAVGFPGSLGELEPGRYRVQAVVRLNRDTHRIGDGEGNAYGPVIQVKLDPKDGDTVALKVDKIVPPRVFPETDRIKLVELPSPKLSAFHHRPITHRAAVILPQELAKAGHPAKRPALYIIPGFGGDHFMAPRFADNSRMAAGKDFIRVLLDPDCGTGHHVFADSATNGPRGAALVEEFIPYVETTLPIIADPRARLLNGHSSGGWSSLWLQVTYPDVFGGTWSTSPDPVDFRDFQQIDIYSPGENMFRDREGKIRPIARRGSIPALFYDRFSQMDDVIGWGGQLGSFEAVFSPLDRDGRPRRLWNRSTGAIDPGVARAWEAYDIRLVLERNWPALGPKLKGKLHVITGGLDTFYLEGAVKRLKESLTKLGSDAVVEIVPNRDHGTVLDAELAQRLDREMKAAVSRVWPGTPDPARTRPEDSDRSPR
jgi:pimeloyl-ACP methyl ester carboxylesterase